MKISGFSPSHIGMLLSPCSDLVKVTQLPCDVCRLGKVRSFQDAGRSLTVPFSTRNSTTYPRFRGVVENSISGSFMSARMEPSSSLDFEGQR
jgi:hypothetical protein